MKVVKYLIIIVLGFAILLTFDDKKMIPSPLTFEVITTDDEVNLIIAQTDTIYPKTSLKKEVFWDSYQNVDGKRMNSIAKITDTFIEEVIKRQPDGLILSGDLTFNGEERSDEELAMKF